MVQRPAQEDSKLALLALPHGSYRGLAGLAPSRVLLKHCGRAWTPPRGRLWSRVGDFKSWCSLLECSAGGGLLKIVGGGICCKLDLRSCQATPGHCTAEGGPLTARPAGRNALIHGHERRRRVHLEDGQSSVSEDGANNWAAAAVETAGTLLKTLVPACRAEGNDLKLRRSA